MLSWLWLSLPRLSVPLAVPWNYGTARPSGSCSSAGYVVRKLIFTCSRKLWKGSSIMPSPKPPAPPSPQESASAAVQATLAGDEYQTLNAPLQGYADLYLQSLLGPSRSQLSSGLNAQTALQGAMAQKDIQSRTDPQAY